jgi:hypothetical protein
MLRLALVTVFVLVVAAAPAGARTTRAEDARARAHVHWKSGSERYAAGQWSAALDEFEAGYAAQPSPAFLVNIGQCLRKLDRLAEAALAFRRFLDAHSGSPRTRLDVYDALEDVTTELNARVDSLAESAALFAAYERSPDADPALRAQAAATRQEILRTLVAIDDHLVNGYGVARALALPRGGVEVSVASVRQRLAQMAATRRPTATTTNHRSLRSISHHHMRRKPTARAR